MKAVILAGGLGTRLAGENEGKPQPYGDGVCDVDLRKPLAFPRSHGMLATITAVRPPARFGGIEFDGDRVSHFREKPQIGEGWINGGFMVLEPKALEYLADDQAILET